MSDSRSFFDRVRSGASAVQKAIAGVVAFASEIANRFNEIVHAAEQIARRYRWCISTSWPFPLIVKLGEMAERGAPYHEFEARIMDFYRAENWRELEELVEATCRYESVSSLRYRVLRDTVPLIRAGERDGFNAASFAVPTLFAHLEGMLRDYARDDLGLIEGATKKSITVRDITPSLRAAAAPVERASLDVMTNLLYRSYRSKNPPKGYRFNRHLFNHGRALEPGRTSYVVRLLLMINQTAYLIDKVRGVDNDAVQLRESWSQMLSAGSSDPMPWRNALRQREEQNGEIAAASNGDSTPQHEQ